MNAEKRYSILRWLVIAVLSGALIVNVLGQVAPGYIDIVSVPTAPGNPSSTCFAGKPCNRLYVLGASGGTGATGTFSCKTTNGGSCGAGGATGATGASGATGATGATGSGGGGGGGGAMTLIAQQILASPVATVTFSSISGTYTNLYLTVMGRTNTPATQQDDIYMQANGDTNANYDRQFLLGQNTTASAGTQQGVAKAVIGTITAASALANAPGSFTAELDGYAATTFFKQAHSIGGWINGSSQTWAVPIWWEWRSTSAITSITLGLTGSGSFITGSTFTLYGLQ